MEPDRAVLVRRVEARSSDAGAFPVRPALVAAVVITTIGMIMPGLGYTLFGGAADAQFKVPPVYPPQWMFWAVWLLLYPLMGIATAYVWQARYDQPFARFALWIFATHLLVNVAWVPVVQASGRPLIVAVVMDVVVDVASLVAAGAYARVSRQALLWLVPYLGWEVFTTIIKIWRLFLNI